MKKIFFLLSLLPLLSFGVTAGKVWRVPTAGTIPSWGPINLDDATNAVNGTLATSNIDTNPNFSGSTVAKVGSLPIPVTEDPGSSKSLRIVRGFITAAGGLSSGEGFTPSKTGTGKYRATFTTPFGDSPGCACSQATVAAGLCNAKVATSVVDLEAYNLTTDAFADMNVSFICIGLNN